MKFTGRMLVKSTISQLICLNCCIHSECSCCVFKVDYLIHYLPGSLSYIHSPHQRLYEVFITLHLSCGNQMSSLLLFPTLCHFIKSIIGFFFSEDLFSSSSLESHSGYLSLFLISQIFKANSFLPLVIL